MSACWHTFASYGLRISQQHSCQSQPLLPHSLSYSPNNSSHATNSLLLLKLTSCSCSPLSVTEPSSQNDHTQQQQQQQESMSNSNYNTSPNSEQDDEDEEEEVGISKIQVPRHKHIPVSKSHLLDAILSTMFNQDQHAAHHFRLLTSCLDSILHAEHKSILEEMRSDYQLLTNLVQTEDSVVQNSDDSETQIVANGKESNLVTNDRKADQDMQLPNHGLDLTSLLRSLDKNSNKDYDGGSRVTIATRFQRAFMQLLSDAQFEELSARDLMLTSALNTDYLLTLPVYVDWKRAYKSNAIIFRRGYATEKQKGLLIVEKLDYLQSILLRRIFCVTSKPLGKLGTWISEVYENASQKHEVQSWTERVRLWLKELPVFQKSLLYNEHASDEQIGANRVSNGELPIWLAAQRVVARYEGILSPVGPRERLLRRLLDWTYPPYTRNTF